MNKQVKDYKNYSEQVSENVNLIEVFQGELPEFWYELEREHIESTLEGIYLFYKVELKGCYNEEHERLHIVWYDELESYLMPVYSYGMPWKYIGVME